MDSRIIRACCMAVGCAVIATSAFAQEPSVVSGFSRGTTLNVFAGAASEPAGGSAMAGGAVGWQLTRTTAIEGSGSWINNGPNGDWFAGALKLQAATRGIGSTTPFVEAGIGLYRASFGAVQGNVPRFYERRIAQKHMDEVPLALKARTFTDPSVVVGGGLSLRAARHITIRPAVEVTAVLRNNHAFVTTGVLVRLAYHFEDHPVTRTRLGHSLP